jgi:hypothetical protein
MALQYLIANGATQTTAGFVKMATSNAIKTLLQLKFVATVVARIIEWGFSADGSAAATPGLVELIETGTVPATGLTAYATADITRYNADAVLAGDPVTALITVSTSTSGFNTSGGTEGSITATRNLDSPQLIAPTTQFIKQFPLGREPIISPLNYMRIRTTFGTTVNCVAYVIVEI